MATFSLQNSIRLELPLFYSTYLGGGDDEDLSSDGDLAIHSAGTDLVYSAHWTVEVYAYTHLGAVWQLIPRDMHT